MGLSGPGRFSALYQGKNFMPTWTSLSHQQPEPWTFSLSEQHCS